ncbi:MAG: heme-binding protein [Pseudomonadota bacterium]|nr:heme-binding protein [Pseudomonadota bacterium]
MGWTKRVGLGAAAAVGVVALASAGYAQYRDNGEEPSYKVLKAEDAFELRDYEPMIVAEVTHNGDRRRASGRSFRRLAAYIFGQDRPDGGEKIAMTAPVIQERVDTPKVDQDEKIAMTAPVIQEQTSTDTWRMRFVMPAKYTMETLPTAPDDITLVEVPARRIASVRFNGYGSPSDLTKMEAYLTQWVGEQGLTPMGDFEYAFYDAPMVPGQIRRNEILIEIKAD